MFHSYGPLSFTSSNFSKLEVVYGVFRIFFLRDLRPVFSSLCSQLFLPGHFSNEDSSLAMFSGSFRSLGSSLVLKASCFLLVFARRFLGSSG